jgi:hypothetical protein
VDVLEVIGVTDAAAQLGSYFPAADYLHKTLRIAVKCPGCLMEYFREE